MGKVAGDDYTTVLAAYGFGSLEKLKQTMMKRFSSLKPAYLDPLADLPMADTETRFSLWENYRPGYLRHLTETAEGTVTAKIIDFDGRFLENDPPSIEEEITGDTNYFSPEVCARAYGKERKLSCKLDVFAVGVLFHQYFFGQMPGFDPEACYCPGEALRAEKESHKRASARSAREKKTGLRVFK